MGEGGTGHCDVMSDDEQQRPKFDQPLHGEPRPRVTPILAVLGMIVGIAVIAAVITLLRYYAS